MARPYLPFGGGVRWCTYRRKFTLVHPLMTRLNKLLMPAALFLGATAPFGSSAMGAAVIKPLPSDPSVAERALQIVAGIHGLWQQMPGNIATWHMTGGALLGNGSVGVAIGGSPDQQEFYVGRNDFWSVLRGSIMPVGRLEISIPSLRGAAARLSENIGNADVTGTFDVDGSQLKTKSWVAARQNTLFVRLENSGKAPLDVSAALLDGFGQKSRETLGGSNGDVSWLKVSPEVVQATIGGLNEKEPGPSSDAMIQSVRVFDTQRASTGERPVYQWRSEGALNADNKGGANSGAVFSCGNIIMPQRRFSVSASIDLAHAEGSGVIFDALVEHRWMQQAVDPTDPLGNTRGHDVPRAQGAEAGLLFAVSHGKLTANLNGTVVASSDPLPHGQWITVEVAYDGAKMILRVNDLPVGESSAFPSANQVMGPQFSWMASHPGDSRIPFDGIAPEGVLATRILGAAVTYSGGESHFSIPAGGHVTLAIDASDNRDTREYLPMAVSRLRYMSEAGIAATHKQHLQWWRQFWSKSFVMIPDKTVESWYYGSLYVLASCSRHGNVAPGLWGNWITSTRVGWDGDYTLDYNYQAPFWAAFPTNHVDLADPYDDPVLAWMPRGRGLAQQLGSQGLVYYTHLAPSPGWSGDNFRSLDQKSDALFAAVNCIQRWRYTRDLTYARKVWPFLVGVADFWDHDLKLVDGRYVDTNDAEDEHLWGPAADTNPATVIGFLNMLYPSLLDMSKQLHTGEELRATWTARLAQLSPLPLAPAASVKAIVDAFGKPVPGGDQVILESEHGMQWVDISKGDRFSSDPPAKIEGSSAGMNSLQVVFPGWNIGLESTPELQRAAANTVNYTRLWYDSNNTSNFYPAAANAGYDPNSILDHLHRLVTNIGFSSFAYKFEAGGVENEATVPTTLAAMFLQSYQADIHVFPNWPKDQNASFGNLLAVGNFLVSSSIKDGQVVSVTITSQIGGPCNLSNPWGSDQVVQQTSLGKPTKLLHGSVLSFLTNPGQRLVFTRGVAE